MAYGCRIAKESGAIADSNDAERIMALNGVFDKKQKGRIRHRGFAEAIQGDFELEILSRACRRRRLRSSHERFPQRSKE